MFCGSVISFILFIVSALFPVFGFSPCGRWSGSFDVSLSLPPSTLTCRTQRDPIISILAQQGASLSSSSSRSCDCPRSWRIRSNNGRRRSLLFQSPQEQESDQQLQQQRPKALLLRTDSLNEDERSKLVASLQGAGFDVLMDTAEPPLLPNDDDMMPFHRYEFVRATGMLKLVGQAKGGNASIISTAKPPRWIPMIRNMENILVQNGWSFLDPDDQEEMSAFNVDAANMEGTYRPKWGQASLNDEDGNLHLSQLGYSLKPLSRETIETEAESLDTKADDADNQEVLSWTRKVLLEGATDPFGLKTTANGYVFSGSVAKDTIPSGIFVCAIGGGSDGLFPLFASSDLATSTASSGWLSFTKPISSDHVVLVQPESPDAPDQRIEVVCARTLCHLGHYFGKGNGYCINASALKFAAAAKGNTVEDENSVLVQRPISWRNVLSWMEWEESNNLSSPVPPPILPSHRLLRDILKEQATTTTLMNNNSNNSRYKMDRILLGGGCFWHVEFALRRLPGVLHTQVGYAGGDNSEAPTYEEVCQSNTGHAEVVSVTFDPSVLDRRILIDCFLAMHDPTKVRAHGKHAIGTGQYRSIILCETEEWERIALDALKDCSQQLQRELSTEVVCSSSAAPALWCFWKAEDLHQRHDENRKPEKNCETLSTLDWLNEYGKRTESILGGAATLNSLTST